MVQYGYKVVTIDLKSCMAKGKAQVQYILNEWVEAPEWLADKKFTLLYFKNIFCAKALLQWSYTGRCQLYKCQMKYAKKVHSGCRYGQVGLRTGLLERTMQGWPEGTRMARQIKLLDEVKG